MVSERHGILEQLRRNAVAIISLIIALSSLSYNTWRNEKTEENRNLRNAAFEILLKLGELQQNVFHVHYDRDTDNLGNPRIGWAYALTIRDLSLVLGSPVSDASTQLLAVWGEHWSSLDKNSNSADAILQSIDNTRNETLNLLKSLE